MKGKIMWWSDQDKNGIIKVPVDSTYFCKIEKKEKQDWAEYYFDISVTNMKVFRTGRNVLFTPKRVSGVLCAKNVRGV